MLGRRAIDITKKDSKKIILILLSESLTKITEFLDFGATFDLDRIFSFFFHIEGGCNAHLSKTEFLALP